MGVQLWCALCVLLTAVVTLSGAVVGKSICMVCAKYLDRRKGGYSNAVRTSQVRRVDDLHAVSDSARNVGGSGCQVSLFDTPEGVGRLDDVRMESRLYVLLCSNSSYSTNARSRFRRPT